MKQWLHNSHVHTLGLVWDCDSGWGLKYFLFRNILK